MYQYGPFPVVTGQDIKQSVNGFPDTRSVIIYNESPLYCSIQFVGSSTESIAAYTADAFKINDGFTGNIVISPSTYLSTNTTNVPASVIFVQTGGTSDPVSRALINGYATGYPIALNRLSNIGNTSLPSTATAISNDGATTGTVFVEATVSGQTNSSVQLFNQGKLALGNENLPGELDLRDSGGQGAIVFLGNTNAFAAGIFESGGIITLDTTGSQVIMQAIGNVTMLRVTNNGNGVQLGRSSSGDCLDQTSTDLFLKANNGKFNFQSPNGSTKWSRTNESWFTGTGSGTFASGMSNTPNSFAVDPSTQSGSSQTIGLSISTSPVVTTGAGQAWAAIGIAV